MLSTASTTSHTYAFRAYGCTYGSIILIEYSRKHKTRHAACISETIRSVIRTKIIKRHATFACALLRDIRVLFEVLAATTSAVIHFSIAASGLYYDLETGLSKIA